MLFLKHFRQYYFKYAWAFILGVLLLIAIDWYQLEIPRILSAVIDGVDDGVITQMSEIITPLTQILIIIIALTLGRFLWRYLLFGTSRKIETDIRGKMFAHAVTLDQNFYNQQKIGGLMSYFTNDLTAVREIFGHGLLMLVDGLVLGGFVLVRMFRLNWLMTLYAFIPIALMGVLVFFLELRMERKFKVRQESFEKMSDFAQESFSGITVIKAYVREAAEALGFKKRSSDLYKNSMAHLKYAVIVNVIIDVMINLVILAIIAYGAILIAYGDLSSGELTEYTAYFFNLLWPVFALSWFLNINGQAQASAKRIYAFLESKPLVAEKDDAIKNVTLNGRIEAKNLTFTYPDGRDPVLHDVNFLIESGQMVGILGKTGSGKSTLVELLLHIYNTDPGMLLVDDYDIAQLSINTLRNHIGYVPQDNFLFSDTIERNIGFAFEKIEHNALVKAAKLADIDENVQEFKLQYQTMLGERGVTVSGGQKQRISIARALAKDPSILILDDSVSAVDTKTEEEIITNLQNVRKNKTTIFIAHRISTVKRLDKIILLEQGHVVGFGSHHELLESNHLYQEMVRLQELENLIAEVEVHA